MIPINSYEGLINILSKACSPSKNRCLVALLFADSGFEIVKKEILPFIKRFNVRSGKSTHFFFAGYVSEGARSYYKDSEFVLEGPYSRKWYFSALAFENIRRDLEKHSKWKYSGGVDFLLLDAVRNSSSNELDLQFDKVVSFELVQARETKRVEVLSKFFEEIFRYSEENLTIDDISDTKLLPFCIKIAEGTLKRFLPDGTIDAFKEANQYAVLDIRK